MSVEISTQKCCLKEQHATGPYGWPSAKPRQNKTTDERLYLEQQKRTDEHSQSITKHRLRL